MMGTPVLMDLAAALHRYGATADRLEEGMDEAAAGFGVDARFLATPTSIMVATQEGTRLLRVDPGQVDLSRLVALEALLTQIANGMPIDAARARLREIESSPDHYGRWTTLAAFALASAAAARFLGGGTTEIACGLVEGAAVGMMAIGLQGRSARIFEPLAAFVVTALAIAGGRLGAAIDVAIVAGLIVLVPGMTLTTAMTELAGRHLVSGGARLTGALMVLLELGFGVALASRLGASWWTTHRVIPLPEWTLFVAIAASLPALTVLLRAPLRDLPAIVLGSVAGYLGARLGAATVGADLAAFSGAVALTACAEGYRRVTGRPSVVVQVPSLMLLVPGTIGFRSVSALVAEDAFVGVKHAFDMMLVAASIVVGTLVTALLTRPRPPERVTWIRPPTSRR
jgi:uncharacterized membrane protein YjjP (DUF1212 family)